MADTDTLTPAAQALAEANWWRAYGDKPRTDDDRDFMDESHGHYSAVLRFTDAAGLHALAVHALTQHPEWLAEACRAAGLGDSQSSALFSQDILAAFAKPEGEKP